MDLLRRAGSRRAGGAARPGAAAGRSRAPPAPLRRPCRPGAGGACRSPTAPLLERYAAGVNAGLAALQARPFEYGLLRATPRRWRAEDTLLVVWAMYFDLQDDQLHARLLARLAARPGHDAGAARASCCRPRARYDAPLDAAAIDEPAAPMPAEAPAWFGKPARRRRAAAPSTTIGDAAVGSNNWVVAGTRSRSGARDGRQRHAPEPAPAAHLVPRRARDRGRRGRAAATHRRRHAARHAGVVAGSNGQVAWGMTNSYGAYLDLLELEFDPRGRAPLPHRPPAAARRRRRRRRLGPAAHGRGAHRRRRRRRRGAARAGDGVRAGLGTRRPPLRRALGRARPRRRRLRPARARARDQRRRGARDRPALRRAGAELRRRRCRRPHRLDARRRAARAAPRPGPRPFPAPAASAASHTWTALAAPAAHPSHRRPAGGPDRDRQRAPARRRRLCRDRRRRRRPRRAAAPAARRRRRAAAGSDEAGPLRRRSSTTAPSTSRPGATGRCRRSPATATATRAKRAEFRRLLESTWSGRASVDSVAYRLTRSFVGALYARLFGSVDEAMRAVDKGAELRTRHAALAGRHRAPARREAAPAGCRKAAPTGSAVQLAAIDDVIAEIEKEGTPLDQATWGRRNTTRIAHPMASALPFGARWLAAPAEPLPGDSHMPRVAAPAFGQSERFVVAPGREASGRLQHAGRAERPSAEPPVPRRPRRLGRRAADAAAARHAGAHARLRAALTDCGRRGGRADASAPLPAATRAAPPRLSSLATASPAVVPSSAPARGASRANLRRQTRDPTDRLFAFRSSASPPSAARRRRRPPTRPGR